MTGPVWRFDETRKGVCELCLRDVTGLYIEGTVNDAVLNAQREVCVRCYRGWPDLVVGGERPGRISAPAYARRR